MAKKKYTSEQFRKAFASNGRNIKKKTEAQEQTNICKWMQLYYPDVFYNVDLAGINISPAQRKVYSQRKQRGHPDIMIYEWYKNLYCGLSIELKRTGTIVNEEKVKKDKTGHLLEQYNYLMALRNRNRMAFFVSGEENAKIVIKHYLEAGPMALKIINKHVWPKINIY